MAKQLEINIYSGRHGGVRPGAGRPRKQSQGAAHQKRPQITSRTPLHINFKYSCRVRHDLGLNHLHKAIQNAARFEFKVCAYSLQYNHIHLIVEAPSSEAMTSGMRSLTNTFAKNFKKGSIQVERYHLHVLNTPRETRNALSYVLLNDLKHTGKMDLKFTRWISKGKSWLLTSSSKGIASEAWPKFLCP